MRLLGGGGRKIVHNCEIGHFCSTSFTASNAPCSPSISVFIEGSSGFTLDTPWNRISTEIIVTSYRTASFSASNYPEIKCLISEWLLQQQYLLLSGFLYFFFLWCVCVCYTIYCTTMCIYLQTDCFFHKSFVPCFTLAPNLLWTLCIYIQIL